MMLGAALRTTETHHSATTTISSDPPTPHHGHYLPGNPMPYMAPSATHQPELLLLHSMINTITSIIEDLQHHPIAQDPIPPMSSFTNTPAYRLFLQFRNTLRHLINTTYEAQRALNRLQFIPGSPGSPGHYRIDPTIPIPPHPTPSHTTAMPPSIDSPPLLRRLRHRERSRSHDRLPLTTPSQPNHTTHPRQISPPNQSPTTNGHRGPLHRALDGVYHLAIFSTLRKLRQHSVSHLTSCFGQNTDAQAASRFHCSVITQLSPQPFELSKGHQLLPLRIFHRTMDYESPDWDPTPTEPIEVKDEVHDPTEAEPTGPQFPHEVKFELMKKEEGSPPHSTMLCPPVRTVPDTPPTTTTPPPAKAPPVSHASYRNLSTRTTSQATPKTTSTQHAAAAPHPTAPPPPPSTTSSTSTEDPIILTTNVPILPKARPGHPPLNTTWVGPPHSHYPPHPPAPTRIPLQVTIPRPHHNGRLLPFNFSSDINHYLNPTATPARRPQSTSIPAPPTHFQPTTTTNTTIPCSHQYHPFQMHR